MVSRTNLLGFSTSSTVSNFTFNSAGDSLTNAAAGYFYIDAGFNYYAVSNDVIKIMVQTNGVLAANLIAYSDYSAASSGGAFGTNFVKVSGIVYLPANSYVRVYSDWAESTAQTVQLYLGYINAFAVNFGTLGGTGSGTVDPTNPVLANIIGTGALTNAGSSNQLMLTADSTRTTNTFKRYYFDTNQAPILSNLVAACVSGDIAELGAGDFRIGVQTIRVPVGVTLKGQGMGRTKIIGDVGVATNSIVQIMSTNVIEDLTIVANKKANYFQYPIGNNMIFGHPAATNVTLRRVHLDGETDCLLISQSNRVSITIENCEFRSAWDVCNLLDLDVGDAVPGITATIRDSILYSDSSTAQLAASIVDPKSQPLIVSGALVDLITSVVTATNHKAISLSMQGFETNLVYITDTIFRSAGTNGYGKQIDISTDSDVSVSKAIVSSQRIQDSDINGSSGVTYLPAQTGSLRVSTIRSLDDVFATDGLFGRTATITNELQAQTVNTTDLNATGSTVLKDAAIDALTMALATASRAARIDSNGNITNVVSGSPSTEYVKADGTTGTPTGTGTNMVTAEIGRLNITNGINMTGAGSAGLDLVSGTSAKTFSISVPDSLTASSTNKFDFNSPTAGQVIAVHSSSANVTVWTNATASGSGVTSATNFATGSTYTWNGSAGEWSGMGGGWYLNEEFLGDVTTTGGQGVNYFANTTSGGGAMLTGGGEVGAPGVLSMVTTNTSDRAGIYHGTGALNSIRPTNITLTVIARVRAGTTGGDAETFRVGLSDSTSADGNGIYLRHTNGVWQGMTIASSAHTASTGSNVVAQEWTWLGFHLDSTGTNVVFYQGGTDRTMTPFGTNIANIPHASKFSPIAIVNRYAGTTARQTNSIDVFRLRIDRLP